MSTDIRHEMIRASAGSGKTYKLVNRYIRLLALGEPPSRIIALTFTRKAAGEFLQKIFLRLTAAAADAGAARELSKEIHIEETSPSLYRKLLSSLVTEMGDLQLGTIDSFFARIVGLFPHELGLTRPHRIMDEFERNFARQQAMERLLAGGDDARANRILQIYKQLTWGAEEKNVYKLFEEKLKSWHDLYLETRNPSLWGDGARIYHSPPWWSGKEEDPGKLADAIRDELAALDDGAAVDKAFNTLLDAYASWQPGLPLDGATLWERILEAAQPLGEGRAELKFGRKTFEVEDPLAGYLYRMVQDFVRREIARRLVMTQSLGQLLCEFDGLYEQSIREAGSLVFADLPMLLIKGVCGDQALIGASDIVYRLDSQLHHWLIDEFQDTSRIQWKVLSAFVDEVLQDASGERSFFYVGDVKQSIYGWRGGDARLFEEIFQYYNRGEPGIKASSLSLSWRSAPPVLDCVNGLFGDGLENGPVGRGTLERWRQQWKPHLPSDKTAKLSGHAAWGEVAESGQLEPACIELINTVQPIQRGLSCAILMRKNDQVSAMTQALREAGIAASMEGVVNIARDNVAGAWILAFLYSLARPDEAFPRAFIGLPGVEMEQEEYRRLAGLIRSVITRDGFTEAVRRLLKEIECLTSGNPFLERRCEQLLEAATRFGATSLDSLESFIGFLEAATVSESTLHSQVQVMTVHKAKGLDFDMVIVAGFGGETLVRSARQGLHVERGADGEIEWMLDFPAKAVVERDPELGPADAAAGEDATFEALCLLYVAMTRARRGLYCIAAVPERNSKQATWQQLFQAAFPGQSGDRVDGPVTWHREWGTADWFEKAGSEAREASTGVKLDAIRGPLPQRRPALRRMRSPSQEAHAESSISPRLRSVAGREFGTRMHDFLATIEWIPFDDPAGIEALQSRVEPDLVERFTAMLDSPLVREVFTRPAGSCQLWREKPYVLRRGDAVATGIIDRAIVHLDDSGNPAQVVIYDFKTDVLDPERGAREQLLERYGLQLERYREAVSMLTGLAPDRINSVLVPV
jgi:ATP-dependent exoDNAse (exonuclease V) beta subunit